MMLFQGSLPAIDPLIRMEWVSVGKRQPQQLRLNRLPDAYDVLIGANDSFAAGWLSFKIKFYLAIGEWSVSLVRLIFPLDPPIQAPLAVLPRQSRHTPQSSLDFVLGTW